MSNDRSDVAIVGGGIVGLASAWQLTRKHPDKKVIILEKEAGVACHQTGHNSGVLHSGIYYKPGSLKAINCREGKLAMQTFCEEEGLPYDVCGKVIVAVDESELPALGPNLRARPGQRREVRNDRCAAASRTGTVCGGHQSHPRAGSGHRRLPAGLRTARRENPPSRRRDSSRA